MTYRLSLRARDDLRSLYREGAVKFGVGQADRYFEALHDALELLAAFPRSGHERNDGDAGMRILPFKAHIIVYVIEGQMVLVMRIRHGRENWRASPLGE